MTGFADFLAASEPPSPAQWLWHVDELRAALDGTSAPRPGATLREPAISTPASDFFRRLNEDALANLDAWVPNLGLQRRPKREPNGGYRAVAEWRPSSSGRPLGRRALNLSFDPRGIVDFGDGHKTYTAINVVMAACGFDRDGATKWLGDCLGYDFSPKIALTQSKSAVEPEDNEPEPTRLDSSDALDTLTHPPGLVGKIVDWCEATAERPSRAAALGPALGFIATLAGRRFASESDARTNLYIVTLAESGFGKDHARQAIKRLASKAVLQAFLGAGRVMSTTALRNSLLERPAQLLMIDEFHGTIAMVTDKRSPYARLLGDDLLELFASASTWFSGAAYASTPAVNIQNPNLSIYGTSTPDAFWPAAGTQSVTNGLLARFILINIEGAKPTHRAPIATLNEIPNDLASACQALAKAGGNLSFDGNTGRPATVVPYDDEARHVLNDFRAFVEARETEADSRQRPFLNRAVEHAIKLALTVAVGTNATKPIITGQIMDWARKLAWYSTCSLIAETRDRVADSQREADYNRILRLIKEAGGAGLKPSAIPDRTRNIDERRRNEILRDLTTSGRVRFGPVQTKRGSRERYVFVH